MQASSTLASSIDLNLLAQIFTGLNILSIGGSNYDTNRLPVVGGNNNPTSTQCNGCFPLADFDTARNTPLSQPQANPAAVFGTNVQAFLQGFEIRVPIARSVDYQVNSADVLQFITDPFRKKDDTGFLKVFFAKGFPVNGAANVPEFAFFGMTSARLDLDASHYSPGNQDTLSAFYANPASTLNVSLPTLTFNSTANAFVLGSGLQLGQAFTQSAAGATFGLLRQTVERTVGLGTNRQIQFALRFNF